MRVAVGLAVLAAAIPGLAHAAVVSGTYIIRYTTLCQSIENEVFQPNTNVNTIDEGKIQQSIGFITFNPSSPGGASGTLTASLTQGKGSLAILGLPGPPVQPAVPDMKISTGATTGTYALTLQTAPKPSTLKITFTGQPAENFTAYLSKPTATATGSVAGHLDFIDLDGPIGGKNHCVNTGSADLQ